MTDSSNTDNTVSDSPRIPEESEDFSVTVWIDKIIQARDMGRLVGDEDRYYVLDEQKNPSRSDNEHFARLSVEISELRDLMKQNFTACAMRMSAHEIATGAAERLGSVSDNFKLLELYGLKPIEAATSKLSRQDLLMQRLIEIGSATPNPDQDVVISVGDVMRFFDIEKGHYATARTIMENTAKKYPDRAKYHQKKKIGKQKVAAIELIK